MIEEIYNLITPETFAYVLSVYLLVRFEKVLYDLKTSIDQLSASCKYNNDDLK